MKNLKDKIQSVVDLYKSTELLKAEESCKRLIEENPKLGFLYNLLGLIFQGQKKSDDAIDMYEKGIKIDPNFAMLYNNYGLLLYDLFSRQGYDKSSNYIKKSESLYKKSISIDQKIAEPHNNLGTLYSSVNKYKEAEICYKNAISINPRFSFAYFNLGNVCMVTGKFEEAKKSFKQSIEINPNLHNAHRALSRVIKYTEREEHLTELENIYKEIKNENKEGKISIGFALGKAYEDIKNYEKSFKHYEKANLIFKTRLNFSLSYEKKKFADIKRTYSKKLFQKFESCGSGDSTAIFIVGMPRSGTTLVEQILSSHSKVFGADEVETIPYVLNKNFGENDVRLFFEEVVDFDKKNLKNIGEEYIAKMKDFSKNSERITDKLPINFLAIGFIRLILPKSKIVHCKRNPKDNTLSIFKNHFPGEKVTFAYDLNDTIEYYNLYDDLMRHWNQLLPSFIYNLEYEKLINNTENEIKNLLKFCDLKWEDNCLSFYNNKRPIKTASDVQARNKIYKGSVDSWKHYEKYLSKYFTKLKVN